MPQRRNGLWHWAAVIKGALGKVQDGGWPAKVGGIDIITAGIESQDPQASVPMAILLAKLKGSVEARSKEVRSRVRSRPTAWGVWPSSGTWRALLWIVQTAEKSLRTTIFCWPRTPCYYSGAGFAKQEYSSGER